MAEQTKKSKYNFGGHELDAKLYLQNIRDNAETFLNSKTDWTPEQKEEWKHAYTNFTNALQEDINNGGGRFSTDEFGTITDTKGEFSNTDSDNYYYNDKGQQISQEEYDALKKRKQGKYQAFEANRQFASYASQIGKGLREALAAKGKTSDDTNGFDYAKNGFDAYWQKKYNPAGTANDLQPYWNKDKEGEYTNRVAETMADLDDYMSKQEMNDDVKAAYTNYRNILGQYNPSDKNFNLDTWKNNMILAASRAGISGWNNGYFNIGSQSSASSTEKKESEPFDINNDQAVIDKYKLADQIAAHPEQREHLLDLARRQYNQESQAMTDDYNNTIKKQQEAAHNKIWEQWLANKGRGYGDVSKRSGIKWYGNYRWSKNTDPEYQSAAGRQALKNLQAALAKTHWDSDAEGLFTPMKSVLSNGTVLNNLGEHLAYYLPMLRGMGAKFDDNFEEVTDNAGHKLWKVKNSKNKAGKYLYIWNKANGKLGAYRDVPFNVKKAEITKAFYGVKIQSKEEKEASKQKENEKTINNPQTPHDEKVSLTKQEKIGGNPFSDRATFLRTTALATDVGALVASFSGVGAPASALIGAAATAQNQAADMAEGQGFWESLGNNALDYGMDALSVVPFVRGITGTGRIVKTASKLAPHIITALGAMSALKNKDAYLGSWKKMTSNPSQLNRQDWSNIYDSLRLVISGTTAGTQAIKGNRAMKSALSKDKVKVKTNEGYVTVNRDKLEAIKKVKGLKTQNEALQKATGNSNLRFNAARNKYRFWKTKDQAKIKEGDVYDFTKPNTRMINGVEYERPYKWGELGIANHQWQAPKWMNGILDKIEVRGLKPTGRTQASIDKQAARQNSNKQPSDARFVTRQTKAMRDEWKANNATNSEYQQLKASVERARKLAASEQAAGRITKANAYRNQAKQDIASIRSLTLEYNKLRSMVQNGNITFTGKRDTSRQVTQAWNDILKKYGVKYRQGGSIQKLANGNSINGNPWFSTLEGKKVNNPDTDYPASMDMSKLVSIDGKTGNIIDATISNTPGTVDTRYQAAEGNTLENTRAIESHPYYQWFDTKLYSNHKVTPTGEAWHDAADQNIPKGSKASFKDENGNYRTSWTTTNNDIYGNPGRTYKTDEEYTHGVRYDGINGARHSVFLNRGTRYFYKDAEGNKQYVNLPDTDKKNYSISKEPVWSGWSNDKHTWWDDYEITGASSHVNEAEKNKEKPGFKFNNPINKQLIIDMMDQVRVNNAINANNRIAATLKQSPILYDPQEDHRYVQSDLDAEINGQQVAGQLTRTASHPITSDGNLQSMLQLEAVSKGNEAITQGRQVSNQRSREMQEQAWQQELVNHTSRHDVAMKNRESLYNTTNYNKQIDATNINANYTVEDARAQEAILPYKQDREIARAEQKSQRDRLAMRQIDDSLRLDLGKYASYYGLNPDDVQLWEDVYVNGSKTLDDIKKNPVLTRRWNNIKYTVGQIQSDLIGDYYGAPRSKYWTIRQSIPFFDYSTEVKKDKKGAKLNLRKVREAAKGEKLAAAQLKAQTADADRFYKTTKDHIDRMYDAISRTMDYSRTKKKRKKKKNL